MEQTKRSFFFLVILSAFMAFTSLSTDVYLPAMPLLQDDLGGSAALTITSFLVGFAIAQLIWGPTVSGGASHSRSAHFSFSLARSAAHFRLRWRW